MKVTLSLTLVVVVVRTVVDGPEGWRIVIREVTTGIVVVSSLCTSCLRRRVVKLSCAHGLFTRSR